MTINIHTNKFSHLEFSLIGIDAAIANAFRRILIAEIPTLAVEDVFIKNNTSIIQDEVLAHRLGLVPLKGAKEGINSLQYYTREAHLNSGFHPNDHNTIVLDLNVECTWQPGGKERAIAGETRPDKLYNNHLVLAKQFVFSPMGLQPERFASGPIAPTNPDILIAKLRPGQKIQLSMHAIKGIGADHAKYSPVCPASYRLLPHIDITRPILGKDAKKFARCFPQGVIGLEKVTAKEAAKAGSGYEGHEGEVKAVVKDAIKDTVSRECLRHEEFNGKVKLGRIRDHFIFNIESTGQYESEDLFLEAIKVLKWKCSRMKKDLERLQS